MKKLVLAVATVLAAATFVSGAGADGAVYEDSGFLCGIVLPDGGFVTTTNSSFVIFASGKAVLRCEGTTEPGTRDHMNPTTHPDLSCGYSGLPLPYWNTDVRWNGAVQLTCRGHVDLNGIDAARAASTAGTS
jgi:hypothetical protein